MKSEKDRAIDRFIRKAVEAVCEFDFEEADYLYGQALEISKLTNYAFEMHYLKDIDSV